MGKSRISIRLDGGDLEKIDKIVEEQGMYKNRSDFIRAAVKSFLKKKR